MTVALVALLPTVATVAEAQKGAGTIHHELREEVQGDKVYAAVFEVWPSEASATFTAEPRADAEDMKILSGAKAWTDVAANKKFTYRVEVQNVGKETRSLYLDLKRTTAKGDTFVRTITIMVPPQ